MSYYKHDICHCIVAHIGYNVVIRNNQHIDN